MSETIKQNIKVYGEWIRWGLLGVVIACQLWLQQHYVTRVEYEKTKEEWQTTLKSFTSTINEIKTAWAVQESNNKEHQEFNKKFDDHEARLRVLERK